MSERHLEAARRVFGHLARKLDVPFAVRLWDGTLIPLGREAASGPAIAIAGPEVLGALFRRPSFDTLFRRYVSGEIELDGGDLIGFLDAARAAKKATRLRLRDLRQGFPWADALALLLARDRPAAIRHEFRGGDAPRRDAKDKAKEMHSVSLRRQQRVLRAVPRPGDGLLLRLFPRLGHAAWSRRSATSST